MSKMPDDPTDIEEWVDYIWLRVQNGPVKAKKLGYAPKDDFCYFNKKALRLRYAYIYTRKWINKYTYEEMVEEAWSEGKIKKRNKDYNPFSLSIQILFPNIPRSTRNKYGKVLKYAHLHAVPQQWLLGFIVQAGGLAQIKKKYEVEYRELWIRKDLILKNSAALEKFMRNQK